MSWPSPQDYNEAIQTPVACFADEELKGGTLALNHLGLPQVASGSFASVYRMDCRPKSWAVRCFLHNVPDQAMRYAAISNCLSKHKLGFTVPFRYLETGILVHANWRPVLKMRWVQGRTLDHVIEEYLGNKEAICALAELFKTACAQLAANGIAHGDLQHGNIIVTAEGAIFLVDYDGMFVPELASQTSNELGHKNYQHPGRDKRHFGPYLDNFSAWVIYTCLHALSVSPEYWSALSGGDDCLLFKRNDYEQPLRSLSFAMLESSPDPVTAKLARTVRFMLSLPVEQVPPLGVDVPVPAEMPAAPPVEQIRETLARESAACRSGQRTQPQPDAEIADALWGAPTKTVAPAPVKVHSMPVLIAEATAENTNYVATAGSVINSNAPDYGSLNTPAQNPGQSTGTTALDLLLADRRAEDLQSQNYGNSSQSDAYALLRIVGLIMFFFLWALAMSLTHH